MGYTLSQVLERNKGLAQSFHFVNRDYLTAELTAFGRIWQNNHQRYENVALQTNLPPELIAAIHYREGSCNFSTYLHNGDPLGQPTVHVPVGRMFSNWEDAAYDALNEKHEVQSTLQLIRTSKSAAVIATYAERYNGFGYVNQNKISPYVFSGTNLYISGLYVADHVFDENQHDNRPGVLALMHQIGFIFDESQNDNSHSLSIPNPTLRQGDSGDQVKLLQQALVYLGFLSQADMNTGPGLFGPKTKNALMAFQRSMGIGVDGVYGNNSQIALQQALLL